MKTFIEKRDSLAEFDAEGFLLANLMKDNKLLVPAMDYYSKYFQENGYDPDINELRPILVEVYTNLELRGMKKQELKTYNEVKFGE